MPKQKISFGSCDFDATSPPASKLSPNTPALNVVVSFEDALKLNLAIQECLGKLNSYHRGTKAGRRTALNLAIYFDQKRVTVTEGRRSP